MEPIRVAVMGTGPLGTACMERIARERLLMLTAVVGGRVAASQAQQIRHYPDLASLLTDRIVDAVVLAGSGGLLEAARMCLAARVPVMVMRPLCLSVADLDELLYAEAATDGLCLLANTAIFRPEVRAARNLLERGVLGEIQAVQGHCLLLQPDERQRALEWRSGRLPVSVREYLAAELGAMQYLFGTIAQIQLMHSESGGTVSLNLGFANGMQGTLMLSSLLARASGKGYPGRESWRICGSSGTLELPEMQLRHFHREHQGQWLPLDNSRLDLRRTDPLVELLRHFSRCVRKEAKPCYPASVFAGHWQVSRHVLATLASVRSRDPRSDTRRRTATIEAFTRAGVAVQNCRNDSQVVLSGLPW